jgi:DNA-binding MarR family transcriptional regulator
MPKTILQEIQQTRPFPSLQQQVVVNLMRTVRLVEDSWMAFIRRTEGISVSQYNVLRILRGARPNKLKVSEVADRMITRDPDITRLMDRMVKQGIVLRERDSEDRRVVFVSITESGLQLLERLAAATEQHAIASLAGLSPGELRELDKLLDQIRDSAHPFP